MFYHVRTVRRWLRMAIQGAMARGRELAAPQDACPECGERDKDNLLWLCGGEELLCASCGATYRPGVVAHG